MTELEFALSPLTSPGFLQLGTTDIWGWVILCCRGIPGALYDILCHSWPLPARSWKHPSSEQRNDSRNSPVFLGGQSHPQSKTTKREGIGLRSLGMGQWASCRREEPCCCLPLPFSCGGQKDLSPGGFIMLILTRQCDCLGPYNCLETS